ncbi:MAG: response regulator transcription factor [Bacilli bacterium]|jgi:two-component system response regulator AgrA|nr:response regulator transcription factor [Bacilli bacterium]
MVNFIVCDDNKEDVKKVTDIIDNVMMSNELGYKKHIYYDYNEKFDQEIIQSKLPNKIYILDIQTTSRSGIDVARDIRKHDVNSIIIFLTGFNELGMNILNDELMILTFINKLDNSQERLRSALKKALGILDVKNILRFNDHGVIYTIPSEDILYITRDSVERKCIIKTEYNDFKVKKTLTELLSILGKEFKETHRSCIVNMNRVIKIDKKKRLITFDNGETTDLISDGFRKEVGV